MSEPIVSVQDLEVEFRQSGKVTRAVRGLSFDVNEGETVALVGESGSGKSVTALSTVDLLPGSAEIEGSVRYEGAEMVGADEAELRRVRGNDISFIFQEPMTSLNPLHTLEKQLGEAVALHVHSGAAQQLDVVGQGVGTRRTRQRAARQIDRLPHGDAATEFEGGVF